MYEIKSKIFLDLSKTQKSALCNYLRALVKKEVNKEVPLLTQKFIADEKYYLEINASRFKFLNNYMDNENFIIEVESYIKECKKYYEYKKAQAPIIQAQKEFDKKKRKFLQEVKMSKEFPTKKQLAYYNALCKRYNVEKTDDAGNLSKLDIKNLIEKIINEHKTN